MVVRMASCPRHTLLYICCTKEKRKKITLSKRAELEFFNYFNFFLKFLFLIAYSRLFDKSLGVSEAAQKFVIFFSFLFAVSTS